MNGKYEMAVRLGNTIRINRKNTNRFCKLIAVEQMLRKPVYLQANGRIHYTNKDV
jgi:hypothetical protein